MTADEEASKAKCKCHLYEPQQKYVHELEEKLAGLKAENEKLWKIAKDKYQADRSFEVNHLRTLLSEAREAIEGYLEAPGNTSYVGVIPEPVKARQRLEQFLKKLKEAEG